MLPLIYALAEVDAPASAAAEDYAGYPLVANPYAALPLFLGLLPILILASWLWINRTPRFLLKSLEHGGAS